MATPDTDGAADGAADTAAALPPASPMTGFTGLGLIAPLLEALTAEGFSTPTPIQTAAIPVLLAGRDVLGLAQTGTGKTAAFALPIIQRLLNEPRRTAARTARVLVLAPTRELVQQIAGTFRDLSQGLPLRHAVLHGGVGQGPQVASLARGADVLVATPGRLLDLVDQNFARLNAVEVVVLDEADRMLDMGFAPDIDRIVGLLPTRRQTVLFSATMPPLVARLAHRLLGAGHARIAVAAPSTTVDEVQQRVAFVERADKHRLLLELLRRPEATRVLVFAATRHGADRIAEHLQAAGIAAQALHREKTQAVRQAALGDFRSGQLAALVATDIAARGLDVDGVTHVVNFDMPSEPDAYVHRIGRTARAGQGGIALAFCEHRELYLLRAIEKTIRRTIAVDQDHPLRPGTRTVKPRPKPAAGKTNAS
jgi:ATP-dependent RNA helicase RhlE